MFNFKIDLSDHPTLPGVKRRYEIIKQNSDNALKRIEIVGRMLYYQLVNGVEVPVKDIAPDGLKGWPLYAENANMVDASGLRVAMIPESTDVNGVVTPAHYPDGSTGEFDYWMNAYYALVKVQMQPVSIFDMYINQIKVLDARGDFNL
jgi:hypothetical protein